jgi:Domain of unknown function (DUF4136)
MTRKDLVILAVIFSLSACHTSNYLYEYKNEKTKGVDFSKYKTYAWLPTKDTAYTKLINKKNLELNLAAAVIHQLTLRGMTLDTLKPDCLFTYTLVMNQTYEVGQKPPEVYNFQAYAPVYPGQASVYYYIPGNVTPTYSGGLDVTTFRDGSLVIDMIDRQNNKVIWRTSAAGKQDEESRPGVKATVESVVPIMFKKFPVAPH